MFVGYDHIQNSHYNGVVNNHSCNNYLYINVSFQSPFPQDDAVYSMDNSDWILWYWIVDKHLFVGILSSYCKHKTLKVPQSLIHRAGIPFGFAVACHTIYRSCCTNEQTMEM